MGVPLRNDRRVKIMADILTERMRMDQEALSGEGLRESLRDKLIHTAAECLALVEVIDVDDLRRTQLRTAHDGARAVDEVRRATEARQEQTREGGVDEL